ncbi:hypothetical protein [Paenibacillus kribbensis]|uniref:hypothetical protein n=1 Tax=Paenibacillus kribbensis TaxID=172713 RepID=UPI0008398E29|nr:hypothetical protein [Paenibacillus kribbensis]
MINRDRMEKITKVMAESKTRSEKFVQNIRRIESEREMNLLAAGYMCGFVDGTLEKENGQ